MKRLYLWASLGLLLLLACETMNSTAADGCGGCPAEQFCCLAACLPLGSTCCSDKAGASPNGDDADSGALPDGARRPDSAADAPHDASNPCAPRDGSVPVLACFGSSTLVNCASNQHQNCSSQTTCIEWIDHASLAPHAVCGEKGHEDVCDPSFQASHCDGDIVRYCNTNPPGAEPPGWWMPRDCRATWAGDATCATGTPVCTSPTDVACNPSTYHTTCAARCVETTANAQGGAIRPNDCGPSNQCVQNSWSNDQPVCIPSVAVPTTGTSTSEQVSLACVSSTDIHVEQYGYEWTMTCPLDYVGQPGSNGFTPVTTHCFAPPDGTAPACVPDNAVMCSSGATTTTCSDATHVTSCVHWVQSIAQCGTQASPLPCDPQTNACAVPPPCHVGWPFDETCAGTDQKWVAGTCTNGIATLAPCMGCAANANGGVSCGTVDAGHD